MFKNSIKSCSYNWIHIVLNHYTVFCLVLRDCEIMSLSLLLIWRKPRDGISHRQTDCFRLMCFIKCRRILVQNPVGQISLKMMMKMNFCSQCLGLHMTTDCWNVTSQVEPNLTFWTVYYYYKYFWTNSKTAETHKR